MKKNPFLRITAVVATCCLFFTGCASTPPQPLTLSERDLTASADVLYGQLCQSGKLDEIAADFQGGKKPEVSAAPVITSRLGSRNSSLRTRAFSQRLLDSLRNGGHMRVRAMDRATSQGAALNDFTKFDNETGSAKDDPTAAVSDGDYQLRCEIRSAETRLGDSLEIIYTLSAKLNDLNNDAEIVWSGSHEIVRVREF